MNSRDITTKLVSSLEEIKNNIETVENYLSQGNEEERKKMLGYIKRGTCFIAYNVSNETRFVPSRFIGYYNNSLQTHRRYALKDGGETNRQIIKILNQTLIIDEELDREYVDYCFRLGLNAGGTGSFGKKRKFWALNLTEDFERNKTLTGEFPEGRIVERIHLSRERNYRVVQIAKENFLKKFNRLFCQVCDFDFYRTYGKIGKDFIEAHHTIPISEMPPDYKTKPEEIVLLCSNCHKMIHKKRPWLSIRELYSLFDN